jgi:hypothetical protein
MAAKKRPTAPHFISPRGVFSFPKLNTPDTKFKADGEYSVKLRLQGEDEATKALIAKLTPLYERATAHAEAEFAKLPKANRMKLKSVSMNPFVTDVFDPVTEEPTGEVEVKMTRNASGTYKNGPKIGQTWTASIDIFDAAGHALDKPPSIWGGTEGKVSFEIGVDFETGEPGYFIPGTGAGGLKLTLLGVQILKLVSSGGARNAKAHGFGAEEGYAHEAEDEAPPPPAEYGAGAAGNPDDSDF